MEWWKLPRDKGKLACIGQELGVLYLAASLGDDLLFIFSLLFFYTISLNERFYTTFHVVPFTFMFCSSSCTWSWHNDVRSRKGHQINFFVLFPRLPHKNTCTMCYSSSHTKSWLVVCNTCHELLCSSLVTAVCIERTVVSHMLWLLTQVQPFPYPCYKHWHWGFVTLNLWEVGYSLVFFYCFKRTMLKFLWQDRTAGQEKDDFCFEASYR